MKATAFISLRAALSILGLASAELTEILGCFGNNVIEELHFHTTQ